MFIVTIQYYCLGVEVNLDGKGKGDYKVEHALWCLSQSAGTEERKLSTG